MECKGCTEDVHSVCVTGTVGESSKQVMEPGREQGRSQRASRKALARTLNSILKPVVVLRIYS